jgi:hypothetical protein
MMIMVMHYARRYTAVGARHARACEVENLDPTPVEHISWCQSVSVTRRPFGQKTNLLFF